MRLETLERQYQGCELDASSDSGQQTRGPAAMADQKVGHDQTEEQDMDLPEEQDMDLPERHRLPTGPSSTTKPTPATATERSRECFRPAATEGCRKMYATATSEVTAAINRDSAVKKNSPHTGPSGASKEKTRAANGGGKEQAAAFAVNHFLGV